MTRQNAITPKASSMHAAAAKLSARHRCNARLSIRLLPRALQTLCHRGTD